MHNPGMSTGPPRSANDDDETNLSYVHKRALKMVISNPPTSFEAREDSSAVFDFSNELACVTYNAAIFKHLLGGEQGQEYLQRQALDLYQEAFEYFNHGTSLRNDGCAPPPNEVNVFGMAVTSNVGQLYYEVFADYHNASLNFAKLSKWVKALEKQSVGNFVDAASMKGFVFNAMLLRPTLASAA